MAYSNKYFNTALLLVLITICITSSSAIHNTGDEGTVPPKKPFLPSQKGLQVPGNQKGHPHSVRQKRESNCVDYGLMCNKGETSCCNDGDCQCDIMIGKDPKSSILQKCKCVAKGSGKGSPQGPHVVSVEDVAVAANVLEYKDPPQSISCIKSQSQCVKPGLIAPGNSPTSCCPGSSCSCKENLIKGRLSKGDHDCTCLP